MEQRTLISWKWMWWTSLLFLITLGWILHEWGNLYPDHQPKPTHKPKNSTQALRATAAVSIQDQGKRKPLLQAIQNSLEYLSKTPKSRSFPLGSHKISRAAMQNSLRDTQRKLLQWGLTPAFFSHLKKNYAFFESTATNVLYTGYFEASLHGSKKRGGKYLYPLYRRPNDLHHLQLKRFQHTSPRRQWPRKIRARITQKKQIVPYYSRSEIDDKQKLAGKGLELVWIDNPVDVFFLHIQGSGIVTLPNGRTMRVNYADQNGHPYRAIGRYMLQKKMLERGKVSMQSIKAYLKKNPRQQREIFNYNPSYIFFRRVKRGPQGSLGVPVTAYRSIATDWRLFPRGALCLIQTKLPAFDKSGKRIGWKPFVRLVMNQDTGGAIRGPGRVDLFTGFGPNSELVAGHLQSYGKLFFLLKKTELR